MPGENDEFANEVGIKFNFLLFSLRVHVWNNENMVMSEKKLCSRLVVVLGNTRDVSVLLPLRNEDEK